MKPQELKSCCAQLYELPLTTLLLGPSFHPGGIALTKRLAIAAIVGRETRVLDVASGIGESARAVASHFGCEVVGVDYSEANVARARALTSDSRCTFVHGDAEALPFDDASFDVVLCECALCTFPNMSKALCEMKRVLKVRGRVAISDIVLNAPVPQALDNVLAHALCIRGALSSSGYAEALVNTGFSAVRTRDASQVLHDMIADIEVRIAKAERLNTARPLFDEDPRPTLIAAREFIRGGGGGYVLVTARR